MNQIVFLLMTLTLLLILSTLRIGWEEHGESVENRLCETDEITRSASGAGIPASMPLRRCG